jgi:hypothetical protein
MCVTLAQRNSSLKDRRLLTLQRHYKEEEEEEEEEEEADGLPRRSRVNGRHP